MLTEDASPFSVYLLCAFSVSNSDHLLSTGLEMEMNFCNTLENVSVLPSCMKYIALTPKSLLKVKEQKWLARKWNESVLGFFAWKKSSYTDFCL